MCGIFGYLGNKTNAAQLTLAGLKTLEYRGYDSWGIAIQNSQFPISNVKQKSNVKNHNDLETKNLKLKTVLVEKHIGKIGEAQTSLPAASIAIGHTRWATHGGVTDQNAHPHLNSDKTIAVVHNGIVENYQELRTRLQQSGVSFTSETDTEVIAHLIDEKLRRGVAFAESVRLTFLELVGSNAIVAMHASREEIVACRDGSPLLVGIGTDESILASDVTALLPYTQQVYFMQDGELVCLSRDGISLRDISTGAEKKMTSEKVEWTVETAQKGGYPHYMLKEIMEQVSTIPKALSLNAESISALIPTLRHATRIIIVGCGTAYHCALLAKYFFAAAHLGVEAIAANEFPPFADMCDERSVIIAISQSGETADTLIAVKAARARGAHIVAIVNARASTLERIAHTVLSVGAGPEISVVSTKAFTAQATTLYQITHAVQASDAKSESAQSLTSTDLATKLSAWLTADYVRSIRDIAVQLVKAQDIYVIGRFANYPTALESALKIKEASYIHAEGFASGELKHGVIALIQKGTPCIVIASEDHVKKEILSSATEMRTRGGLIIGISPQPAPEYDIHIPTLDLGPLTVLTNAIAGQLLGYHLSVGREADPDKPRNLAKSVTVK